jgi:LSD1 subclass zinc finger protein
MDENQQPNPRQLEKILQMPCPTCNSELSYSAEKQMINCRHCGYTQDYERASDQIKEQSLSDAAASMSFYSPAAIHKQVIECESCRAQLMIEQDAVAIRCNFCGSEKVNKAAFNQNLIQPQGIIPFKIQKREAVDKFKKWIAEGWFRPNALKKMAELGDIQGIYLPFWTYDSESYTQWRGEAGFYYYVEVEKDGKTEKERRTRWESRNGSFNRSFDDVLILASKGKTREVVEGIFPYQLTESVNYNPTLMVGWQAEIYTVDVKEGYQQAEKKMYEEIKNQAEKKLGGDTQRGLHVEADFYEQTFKHLILPVWLCTYKYGDKAYQFAVNGQTGKIEGQKPVSWFKIILLILTIVAIIAAVVIFTQKN